MMFTKILPSSDEYCYTVHVSFSQEVCTLFLILENVLKSFPILRIPVLLTKLTFFLMLSGSIPENMLSIERTNASVT